MKNKFKAMSISLRCIQDQAREIDTEGERSGESKIDGARQSFLQTTGQAMFKMYNIFSINVEK